MPEIIRAAIEAPLLPFAKHWPAMLNEKPFERLSPDDGMLYCGRLPMAFIRLYLPILIDWRNACFG